MKHLGKEVSDFRGTNDGIHASTKRPGRRLNCIYEAVGSRAEGLPNLQGGQLFGTNCRAR
jgi:hypothetical protein